MFGWLRRLLGWEQTNEDVLEALDEVMEELAESDARLAELEAKMTAFQTEMWEYVDGTLQPLNKRVATRLRRQKESLNQEEDNNLLMKPGMISREQLERMRQHGNRSSD